MSMKKLYCFRFSKAKIKIETIRTTFPDELFVGENVFYCFFKNTFPDELFMGQGVSPFFLIFCNVLFYFMSVGGCFFSF